MQQAPPTRATMGKIKQLLDFVASQDEAVLSFTLMWATSMKQSPQFTGGYFLLTINVTYPPNNGAILNKSQIIDVAMPSAAEAELDELSINA